MNLLMLFEWEWGRADPELRDHQTEECSIQFIGSGWSIMAEMSLQNRMEVGESASRLGDGGGSSPP